MHRFEVDQTRLWWRVPRWGQWQGGFGRCCGPHARCGYVADQDELWWHRCGKEFQRRTFRASILPRSRCMRSSAAMSAQDDGVW